MHVSSPAIQEGVKASKQKSHNNSSRILVVEDDTDVASFTRHVIQKNAYSKCDCDVVTDSYEAIQMLCDHKYNLILLDQNLPGMSGTEFLKKMDEYVDQDPVLGESPHFRDRIPVIMMSGGDIAEAQLLKLEHFEIVQLILKKHLFSNLQKIIV